MGFQGETSEQRDDFVTQEFPGIFSASKESQNLGGEIVNLLLGRNVGGGLFGLEGVEQGQGPITRQVSARNPITSADQELVLREAVDKGPPVGGASLDINLENFGSGKGGDSSGDLGLFGGGSGSTNLSSLLGGGTNDSNSGVIRGDLGRNFGGLF